MLGGLRVARPHPERGDHRCDWASNARSVAVSASAIKSGITLSGSPLDTDSASASNGVVESVWRP